VGVAFLEGLLQLAEGVKATTERHRGRLSQQEAPDSGVGGEVCVPATLFDRQA